MLSAQSTPSPPAPVDAGVRIGPQVADGLFVQHKWGANSGQIGIPNESLKEFAQLVLSMSGKGAAKPASKGVAKKEKKKKEPEKKPTAEELDADLGAPSRRL